MDMQTQIETWVQEHQEELLEELGRLVKVRSVRSAPEPGAPFGAGPAQALALMLELCGRHGFSTRNYDNCVGTADLNHGEHVLDILGHLDVVDAGAGWETPPFVLSRDAEGYLYGRGVDDDKGPMLAALYAMRCVRELGLHCTKNVRLIFGTDEESGFSDLPHYYNVEAPAPHTFSPDAQFPVYNTEKGHYTPVFTCTWLESDALPRVLTLSGGTKLNVLPAEAQAAVSGLPQADILRICTPLAEKLGVWLYTEETPEGVRIAVSGHSAHASTPEAGVNGITALIELLCALPLAECGSTAALYGLKKAFPHGDSAGTALGIAMKDKVSGALTVAFSLLELGSTGLKGQFDSRTPLCADETNCRAVCEGTLKTLGFAVSGEMEKPHHTDPDSDFVKTLLRCYTRITGNPGRCLSMGGSTYVHGIPGGVAFGAGAEGFDSRLHGDNERVRLESLLDAVKIFALVIAEIAA